MTTWDYRGIFFFFLQSWCISWDGTDVDIFTVQTFDELLILRPPHHTHPHTTHCRWPPHYHHPTPRPRPHDGHRTPPPYAIPVPLPLHTFDTTPLHCTALPPHCLALEVATQPVPYLLDIHGLL